MMRLRCTQETKLRLSAQKSTQRRTKEMNLRSNLKENFDKHEHGSPFDAYRRIFRIFLDYKIS